MKTSFGPSELIKILWKRGFFKERRSLWDVENKIAELGFSFSKNSLQIAIKRSKFLTRNSTFGNVPAYIQKYPSELPIITSETVNEKSMFDDCNFHSKIVKASKSLFETKHYPQAVFEAFKAIEIYVKKRSGVNGLVGQSLMMNVFDSNNPKLKINALQTDSDKDEQEGYRFIFAGVMRGIKDPKSHDDIIQNDPKRTLQLLSLANLLIQIVDASIPVTMNDIQN